MPVTEVATLVEHLFRRQAGQMLSTLTRIFGSANLDLAEEVVQEALLTALQQWRFKGVPENPSAWLVQVAKNRALDRLRRDASFREKLGKLQELTPAAPPEAAPDALDDELQMMFLACHPALPRETRVALTLKTVGGFGVREIARAFLAQDSTIAQRLVRAKRQIREEAIDFEMPAGHELQARLDSVLEALYLMFNEGYAAAEGPDLVRGDVCREAIRLGSMLVAHRDTALPKTHALLALMLLQAARLPARVNDAGDLSLLVDQDRSVWDRRMIARGMRHLDRSAEGDEISAYHLEAGVAACHACALSFDDTDWRRIAELYAMMAQLDPSPVVTLNRAVAVLRCEGADAALALLESVREDPALRRYYLLWATLGELALARGDAATARKMFQKAMECPCSEPERRFLRCRGGPVWPPTAE